MQTASHLIGCLQHRRTSAQQQTVSLQGSHHHTCSMAQRGTLVVQAIIHLALISALAGTACGLGARLRHSSAAAGGCEVLLQAEADAHCMPVELASTRVAARWCKVSEAVGFFVLRPGASSPAHSTGTAIYRVRLVGPEVLLADMRYCPDQTAFAHYALTLPGSYHFEFLHLYDGYTSAAPPQLSVHWFLGTWSATLAFSAGDACSCGRCYACASLTAAGRWVTLAPALTTDAGAQKDALQIQKLLWNTCIPLWNSISERHLERECGRDLAALAALPPESAAHSALQWQPYDCWADPAKNYSQPACMQDRFICFVGDSHMRHLYLGFLSSFGIHTDILATEHAAVPEHVGYAKLIHSTFGEDVSLEGCTDVLANFGQWPLGHTAGDQPWTSERYAAGVHKYATMMEGARSLGKRVWWVTINASPTVWSFHGAIAHAKDWRTDPMLQEWNALASGIMQAAGIPVINTYAITSVVNDVSYDSATTWARWDMPSTCSCLTQSATRHHRCRHRMRRLTAMMAGCRLMWLPSLWNAYQTNDGSSGVRKLLQPPQFLCGCAMTEAKRGCACYGGSRLRWQHTAEHINCSASQHY